MARTFGSKNKSGIVRQTKSITINDEAYDHVMSIKGKSFSNKVEKIILANKLMKNNE